jgi:hypothetical protein
MLEAGTLNIVVSASNGAAIEPSPSYFGGSTPAALSGYM